VQRSVREAQAQPAGANFWVVGRFRQLVLFGHASPISEAWVRCVAAPRVTARPPQRRSLVDVLADLPPYRPRRIPGRKANVPPPARRRGK
jgi:hypothetical protein